MFDKIETGGYTVKKLDFACNPYLPGKEHVPDGEPHIFGDRLYVFGSHDELGIPTGIVQEVM